MESAIKPAKTSSNISEIVSKFAKVCRLRSIGVFSSENPDTHNNNHPFTEENSSDATEETTECEDQKIHPQPLGETKTHEDTAAASAGITKLFDTISALKLAYIQLQEAHIPYNPEKIQAANRLVASELKALSEIKRLFKVKQITNPNFDSSLLENLLGKLRSQVQARDSEIFQLQQQLHELEQRNAELDEKLKQKALAEENRRHCRELTPHSFYDTFKATSKSIHDFAKPLISLMKASGWDLDKAANSIQDSISYSTRSHKKYAFEAYLSRRMFRGFPLQPHNVDRITELKDPFDALIEDPHSDFAEFCRSKYILIVHPKMEASFFGNLDQRTFVLSGRHPRTPFYHAFVKMAKWVWVLKVIAASSEPKAEIFGVRRGSEFSEAYMESVAEDDDAPVVFDGMPTRLSVGFIVMPGFKIGHTVIRSRVCLTRMR